MAVNWWQPIGHAGRVEVRELLSPEAWPHYLADPMTEVDLGGAEVAGQVVRYAARTDRRTVQVAGDVVAELDLSAPADPTGGWDRPIRLLGTPGRAVLHSDRDHGSRLRGPLRVLRIDVGPHAWSWRFEGGRTAGERLVLVRAGADHDPIAETWPAGQGRSLGNPRGGATTDSRVTAWREGACLAEIVLAELLACARLDPMVDYRPARVAGGIGELLGSAPRAEANTE